jgi:hypothetical protein
MHSTSSTKLRLYKKTAKVSGVGNYSTITDWRKNQKDIQSFSMTVEAGVSRQSHRTLKKAKARCFR